MASSSSSSKLNELNKWLMHLATSFVKGQVQAVEYLQAILKETPRYVNELHLPGDVAKNLRRLAGNEDENQQEATEKPRANSNKRAPKRSLVEHLMADDDGTILTRKKTKPSGAPLSAGSGVKEPHTTSLNADIHKYADHLKTGFGSVLGKAILYFLKMFDNPNPPLAQLKRAGVIDSLFQIMKDNPDDTMVAGSMVVLNYFIYLSPIDDISPLDPIDLCEALHDKLLEAHHNQISIEASQMIRNLTVLVGRDNMLKQGIITTLTKSIAANRENAVIVIACLRALHRILYGETPPPDKEELHQLLFVLRNIIYRDDEGLVYYAASTLSSVTMYEDTETCRYILGLNLHAAIVQLLDVNPRIKRVALLLLEDLSYSSADGESDVLQALLSKPKLLHHLKEVLHTSNRKAELICACRILCNFCTGNAEVLQALLVENVLPALTHLYLHFPDVDVLEVVCWALHFALENCSPDQLPRVTATPGFFEVVGRGFMTYDDRDKFDCELVLKLMVTLARVLQHRAAATAAAAAGDGRCDVSQLLAPLPLQRLKDLGDSDVSYVQEAARALLAGSVDQVLSAAARAPPATPLNNNHGTRVVTRDGSSSSSSSCAGAAAAVIVTSEVKMDGRVCGGGGGGGVSSGSDDLRREQLFLLVDDADIEDLDV